LESKRDETEELVSRAREGDEEAISRLITLYKGLIYTIIYRMVNDPDLAQDLTQETFIKVFLKIKTLKRPAHFRAWTCSIGRNLVYDHLRKEQRRKTVPLEEIGEQKVPSGIEKRRKRMIIQDALMRLERRDRMLLSLVYYQGMTHAEVARIMKIPESNIKVYIHRARKRLRRELEGFEDGLLSVS